VHRSSGWCYCNRWVANLRLGLSVVWLHCDQLAVRLLRMLEERALHACIERCRGLEQLRCGKFYKKRRQGTNGEQSFSSSILINFIAITQYLILGSQTQIFHIYNMAHYEIATRVNACTWVTRYRKDGTSYRMKAADCGHTDCRYSDNYVQPQ
jgi:hypothetical protein